MHLSMKTIVVLSFFATFIKAEENDLCSVWFPEPVSYELLSSHSHLSHSFEIIYDLTFIRDDEYNETVGKYVVETLNEENSGYSDILSIVVGHLPSVRKLIISVFSIILAIILLLVTWKLTLMDVFEFISEKLKFDKYRVGLSVIPLFCIIGLSLLSSRLNTIASTAIQGRNTLFTANDQSFMSIKQRIAKKMTVVECILKKEFLLLDKSSTRVHGYIEQKWNGKIFDQMITRASLLKSKNGSSSNDQCDELEDLALSALKELQQHLLFDNLTSLSSKLEMEYFRIVQSSWKSSSLLFSEAVGQIDEFVAKYYDQVLLLPTPALIHFFQYSTSVMIVVAFVTSTAINVFIIMKIEFYKKHAKWAVQVPVILSIVCTILCLTIFIALIIRISFIVVVHERVQKRDFELFSMADKFNISRNNKSYSVDFGNVLTKAKQDKTTLFTLLEDNSSEWKETSVSELFKPSSKFNETLKEMLDLSMDYNSYAEKSCQMASKAFDNLTYEMSTNYCMKRARVEALFQLVNKTMNETCRVAKQLKKPEKEKVLKEGFNDWMNLFLPKNEKSVVPKKAIEDFHSVTQIYLVFENPSKKLRPTILEHLLAMAFVTVCMAPIHFVLSIYFMITLPLLLDSDEFLSSNETEQKTK